MKIDSNILLKERKIRAWSQQHLAEVAELSLRTVQRIETTGNASPESTKAIAAALNLKPQDIILSSDKSHLFNFWSPSTLAGVFFAISIPIFYILFFTVTTNELAAETDTELPTNSALSWLTIVDSGNYAESWQQAAPFFQKQLPSVQWQQALTKTRKPLGSVISRDVTSASKHKSLPAAPKGEYIVLLFATSFEHSKISVETIAVMKTDKQWKVVGYFIK